MVLKGVLLNTEIQRPKAKISVRRHLMGFHHAQRPKSVLL